MARKRTLDRMAVVAAAAELADRDGLERLTLAQVAERLNVRVPSLYNHVDGLAGLQRDLALAGMRAATDTLRRAAVGLAGDAALFAIADAYRTFAHEHYGLYSAGLRAPAADDAELQAAGAELIEVVIAVLQPYRLDEIALIHTIRGLRSIVHGFVTLEAQGGFGLPVDCDESFRRLMQLFVGGLHT
ncbi:MAG TPA: TetR-like C-terminal domain-containing protein [Roseiflexaceae bacterium]|nr:TetR-like C-terminal domain-containing protein [Roseiflexaceae bacterium]